MRYDATVTRAAVAVACVLAGATAFGQAPPKTTPSTSQWSKTEGTMADFVSQGYTITAVTRAAEGTSIQEINTSFYLVKGTNIIKCGDGYRPKDSWGYVSACSKLVQPFEAGKGK